MQKEGLVILDEPVQVCHVDDESKLLAAHEAHEAEAETKFTYNTQNSANISSYLVPGQDRQCTGASQNLICNWCHIYASQIDTPFHIGGRFGNLDTEFLLFIQKQRVSRCIGKAMYLEKIKRPTI